ncbi:MAG: DUF4402 domain-containing protein [Gemmatimonadetes bacterium]|nr:DUF4402 domain-containing protein [Gemmatimonadota bacterium]MBK7352120.1 DUF4402 domain-containing protein [Gemmatimonadota bacterium]MBK7717296.1 DUF4402 domain-containing protein [Gemmatimonadota bacterium]MBK7784843.1 DUF4402 domain-containing protein [Gemmatimonadota bacterium]MBK9066516.1 DUF4402 domain-containing protein [Gemmatimonadota bacterium]
MRRCLSLLLFALIAALPLRAQSQVTGLRNLAFGPVIRGVPATVAPNDPVRSGRFYVRHRLNRQVRIQFTLPTRLTRVGGGGNLPITFRTTDGIAQGTAPSSVPVVFNPNAAQTFTLVTSADFHVNLGGRVTPAAAQATGNYTGTVTLTVTFF